MAEKDRTGMSEAEKLRAEAYRLYQLDWMMNHGHSPLDLCAAFLAYLDGGEPLDPIGSGKELDPYRMWEHDAGFGGEIWACFDEFLDSEYRDEAYMARLLPLNLFQKWQDDDWDRRHASGNGKTAEGERNDR